MVRVEPETIDMEELGRSGFALAMQLLGRHEDAADVVQDCLTRLFGRRSMYDPARGAVRPFFLRVVRNRSLDVLRARQRREVAASLVTAVIDAGAVRPDQQVEQREMLSILRRELDDLPGDQREILLLRDFHDLSYAEIAEVLSIPAGTVMSRLHRARAELTRRMQRYR